jgi:hypothetical protein
MGPSHSVYASVTRVYSDPCPRGFVAIARCRTRKKGDWDVSLETPCISKSILLPYGTFPRGRSHIFHYQTTWFPVEQLRKSSISQALSLFDQFSYCQSAQFHFPV